MKGPEPKSFWNGSQGEIINTKWSDGMLPEPFLSWIKKFGSMVYHRGVFSQDKFLVSDQVVLKRMLVTHAKIYQRAPVVRSNLKVNTGKILLTTESTEHARQRKMLNPQFAFNSLKQVIPIFVKQTEILMKQLETVADSKEEVFMHQSKLSSSVYFRMIATHCLCRVHQSHA